MKVKRRIRIQNIEFDDTVHVITILVTNRGNDLSMSAINNVTIV